MMALNPLRAGDRIALVAPASPFEAEKFARVRDILQKRGFELAQGKHIFHKRGYLAGTEAERAADLIAAIKDPSVAAIICVRGGYGSGRLLPWLPFPVLRHSKKIFVGYSDITFLHLAFMSRMDWITFHGPNLIDADSFSGKLDAILDTLKGEGNFSWPLRDEHVVRHGIGSGKVFGGNLTCMTHLLGTEYFPKAEGNLLLLEDCGEALYRLDRMINHLKLSGVLDHLAGIVLGNFKDCGEFREIRSMVLEHVSHLNFPIIAGLPFGHEGSNEVIPLGTSFYLNTYELMFRAIDNPFSK